MSHPNNQFYRLASNRLLESETDESTRIFIGSPEEIFLNFPLVSYTSDSFLGRRNQDLQRGFHQVETIAGGVFSASNKIIDSYEFGKYSNLFILRAERNAKVHTPRVGSLSATKNLGDIGEYGLETFFEGIPLFVVSLLIVIFAKQIKALSTSMLNKKSRK